MSARDTQIIIMRWNEAYSLLALPQTEKKVLFNPTYANACVSAKFRPK